MKGWLPALLALLALQPMTAAGAQEPVQQLARQARAGGWGLDWDGAPGTELALETLVQVEVTGLVARVFVLQTFRNDGSEWMEGLYRFPLPDGAAVDTLLIKSGGRILEGEIRERQSAKRVYQAARDAGQAAGLVVQERANQFQTRVANIRPGEDLSIVIGFLAQVDYRDGRFSLRLPTTFTPRHGAEPQPGAGARAAGPQMVSAAELPRTPRFELLADLPGDLPLSQIESRHHDVEILTRGSGYRVRLALQDELPDRDFVLDWAPEFGTAPRAALSSWSDGQWHYAQLMLAPPLAEALEPRPRELLFVIDTSGSMRGASLEQARLALEAGIAALEPEDRFNLLRFDDETAALFDASLPATAANRKRATRWVRGLRADGGTHMAPALRMALSLPPAPSLLRQVVFVTDGAVGNERELLARIAEELGAARLFTVSIGSAPNSWFMRKAAEIGRGTHTHIGSPEQVAEQMNALWSRIRIPAVMDIDVDWGVGVESYPEIVPDLYAGEPLWMTARLPDPPGTVAVRGTLAGEPWELVALPPEDGGSANLATLWARRKIEALQDGLVFGIDAEDIRRSVTEVALEHDLLTPWTSLVAVDRTPRRGSHESLGRAQVPNLLPAGSEIASVDFAATASGWKSQLALAAFTLLLSGWWLFNPLGKLPRPRTGLEPGAIARRLLRRRRASRATTG